MEPSWAILIIAAGALLAFVSWVTAGRRSSYAWPTWETLLDADGRRLHDRLASDLEDTHEALRLTLRLANAERARGENDEAVRVLREAAAYVARHVPGIRERLWTWSALAHALLALRPPARLDPGHFRSWRLRGASVMERVIRPLLDNAHRFALHVRILLYGLGLILKGFDSAASRARPDTDALVQSLHSMEGLAADLSALDRASLEVLKALLLAREANRESSR